MKQRFPKQIHVGVKAPGYCNCLPVPYLIDQCRLLFWQKMTISSNRLLLVVVGTQQVVSDSDKQDSL